MHRGKGLELFKKIGTVERRDFVLGNRRSIQLSYGTEAPRVDAGA